MIHDNAPIQHDPACASLPYPCHCWARSHPLRLAPDPFPIIARAGSIVPDDPGRGCWAGFEGKLIGDECGRGELWSLAAHASIVCGECGLLAASPAVESSDLLNECMVMFHMRRWNFELVQVAAVYWCEVDCV
jgi:hypothetical protein